MLEGYSHIRSRAKQALFQALGRSNMGNRALFAGDPAQNRAHCREHK
jgi:hypothetical protein